jgi:outer membrane protein assembly factor BamB
MFQADLLSLGGTDSLIVCGSNLTDHGLVMCLSNDLKDEKWRLEVQSGPVRSCPVSHEGTLWVLAGSTVLCLNISNGHKIAPDILLPRTCVSAPVLLRNGDHLSIAFASSDWEGGIMVLDSKKGTVSVCADCRIGPVHKDMTLEDDGNRRQLYISDIYGCLHTLDIDTMEVSTLRLSSSPLTSATTIDKSNIVVGSYDGHLYGVQSNCQHLTELWKFDCKSVVYSRPIQLEDGSIVVCTTAGDILNVLPPSPSSRQLHGEAATLRSTYRIPAEIWSSPTQLQKTSNVIVIGARDSKCHMVNLGTGLQMT